MIRYRLQCGDGEPPVSTRRSRSSTAGAKTSSGKSDKPSRQRGKSRGCGHVFESWFQSSDAYDALVRAGQVTCPACGAATIEKALMAPSVKTTKGKNVAPIVQAANVTASPSAEEAAAPDSAHESARMLATLTPEQRNFVEKLRQVRDKVLASSEYVGKRFADEARKIHNEETDARSIHGEASIEEAKALAEEGIDVFPIPVLPDDRN